VAVAPTRRVTLREAADALGVSKEAVRKRVIRGTLRSDKAADGRVYVYLDDVGDEVPTREPAALISEMREHIEFLQRELERKDAILLNMTEAMKALNPPRGDSSAEDASESPEPRSGTHLTPTDAREDPQTSDTRPWWQRWFGSVDR
jgi:hypothetical protein